MTSKLKTDVLETVSGSGTIALTNQLSGMTHASVPAGSVVQVKNFQTSTVITGTGHIPNDNTTPLNSEGFEVMSLAITPTSATSTLIIEVIAITSHSHDVNSVRSTISRLSFRCKSIYNAILQPDLFQHHPSLHPQDDSRYDFLNDFQAKSRWSWGINRYNYV